jgi:hypothetical protein
MSLPIELCSREFIRFLNKQRINTCHDSEGRGFEGDSDGSSSREMKPKRELSENAVVWGRQWWIERDNVSSASEYCYNKGEKIIIWVRLINREIVFFCD